MRASVVLAESLRAASLATAAGLVVVAIAAPARAQVTTFTEVAGISGINVAHAPAALLEGGANILGQMSAGGTIGDFDNDGDQDVFIVVGGKNPDALYINQGNGTFVNRALEWGVSVKHMGLCAVAGDYDGDGWLDLFVTSGGLLGGAPVAGKNRLYRNTGANSFEEVAATAGVQYASTGAFDGTGAAWGDYDLDGDLDLFVAGWLPAAACNRLFRNEGNGTFTNVTTAAGIVAPGMRGFSPRFVDMDGDRWPELLVAADFGTSRYFRNNRDGTFTDITAASGTGVDDNGMGQTVGDFDNDGDIDWYVTSIYSVSNPESPGTGNMLYWNGGGHTFVEGSIAAGVNQGGWGWGTDAVDIDHDGWLDIVATNGWQPWPEFQNDPTRVWLNARDSTFIEIASSCGLVETAVDRGLLSFDYDNDGDRDILIFRYKDKPKLFRNDLVAGPAAKWLTIRLDTSGSSSNAPNGIGAVVRVSTGKHTLTRHIDAGMNYQSQSEMTAHFGVAGAELVDVRVEWPDGTATFLRDEATDRFLTIASGERSDVDGDGLVGPRDLAVLLAAWGRIDPVDGRDLNADGAVDASDLTLLFANWS
ncbi:MAG: VCBS repeat-containing protein [Phycisphaerae bacterium]|nr:VCBS repeat-containing protein [Phycisphaerae bacterium]